MHTCTSNINNPDQEQNYHHVWCQQTSNQETYSVGFLSTDRQTNKQNNTSIWANHQIINDKIPEIWNITRVLFESSQDMMSIVTMTLNCIRSYCDIVCSYDNKLFCVIRLIKTSCEALLTTSWCHVKSVSSSTMINQNLLWHHINLICHTISRCTCIRTNCDILSQTAWYLRCIRDRWLVCFTSHFKIFCLYRDVTIAVKGWLI